MSEWIKCTDRLPEHDQLVIVTDGMARAICVFLDGKIVEKQLASFGAEKETDEAYYFASLEVPGMSCNATHWMPAPELPE